MAPGDTGLSSKGGGGTGAPGESHMASFESHASSPPWRKVSSSSLEDDTHEREDAFREEADEGAEESADRGKMKKKKKKQKKKKKKKKGGEETRGMMREPRREREREAGMRQDARDEVEGVRSTAVAGGVVCDASVPGVAPGGGGRPQVPGSEEHHAPSQQSNLPGMKTAKGDTASAGAVYLCVCVCVCLCVFVCVCVCMCVYVCEGGGGAQPGLVAEEDSSQNENKSQPALGKVSGSGWGGHFLASPRSRCVNHCVSCRMRWHPPRPQIQENSGGHLLGGCAILWRRLSLLRGGIHLRRAGCCRVAKRTTGDQ